MVGSDFGINLNESMDLPCINSVVRECFLETYWQSPIPINATVFLSVLAEHTDPFKPTIYPSYYDKMLQIS